MTEYVKFISKTKIEYAPKNFKKPNGEIVFNFNTNPELMQEYGFKPLIEHERPKGITLEKYEETDTNVIKQYTVMKTSEQLEQEKIYDLCIKGTDVERAIYKAKGMDFEDVINFVKEVDPNFDIKSLRIELKAENFYRTHQFVNKVGNLLGYTNKDIDYLFIHKMLPVISESEESNE